jgi:glucose/arabinose dehydrogenase
MRKRRNAAITIATLAIGLFASACVVQPPPPAQPPPALAAPPPVVPAPAGSPTLSVDKTVVTGLDHPWDIAFVDASTMLYTERPGRISSLVGGVSKLVGTISDVTTTGEDGLMGIAVDPNFATNQFIYVCVSTTANDNRLRRYTVNLAAAANAGLSLPLDLVGPIPHANFHDGCRVRFQPGTTPAALWVTTGDAGQGPAPQNGNGLGGKVLRITTTGAAYTGNASARQWYTKGHRNPQGLAFRPGSNDPYTAEHGPNINDEVNKLVNGGNAGWDPDTGGAYDQSLPMTDLVKFPGAMQPVWRSGDVRTIAPSGITFLSGVQWNAWNGALIIAVLKDSELRVLLMNPDGSVSGQFQVPGSTGTRLRSVVQGPDGNLYVATDVGSPGGAIWKITPS